MTANPQEEEYRLPHDVQIGSVRFSKGVPLRVLVNAATRWFNAAAAAATAGIDVAAVRAAFPLMKPQPDHIGDDNEMVPKPESAAAEQKPGTFTTGDLQVKGGTASAPAEPESAPASSPVPDASEMYKDKREALEYITFALGHVNTCDQISRIALRSQLETARKAVERIPAALQPTAGELQPKAGVDVRAEDAETCEAKCGPAVGTDSEGIPLCQGCLDSLKREEFLEALHLINELSIDDNHPQGIALRLNRKMETGKSIWERAEEFLVRHRYDDMPLAPTSGTEGV